MEKFFLIISICLIIMFSPSLSKLFRTPVVVVEICLGLIAGYFGLIYADETLIL
ncbi:MAG: cation:proton antiporter, partial [Erysipelotrichia bacterium]|nr:cation:proton antiporter [Erysipelotrichia bacterium]